MSPDEELCDLLVDLVSLHQDLVHANLRLEAAAKTGWLMMAKARYVMGPNTVSHLQLPTGESEQVVRAARRVLAQDCLRSDGKVRHAYFSSCSAGAPEVEEAEEEGQVRRRKKGHTEEEEKHQKEEEGMAGSRVEEVTTTTTTPAAAPAAAADPLRWFGVLTPPALKQAKASFSSAVDIAVEVANIQSEILGIENRMKYLQRTSKSAGD